MLVVNRSSMRTSAYRSFRKFNIVLLFGTGISRANLSKIVSQDAKKVNQAMLERLFFLRLVELFALLDVLLLKLLHLEGEIRSPAAQELFVRAALDDLPAVHNEDDVRLRDGGKAVRDDEARPAFHQLLDGFLNELFGERIDGARRLVQDEDGRVCPNRLREGE
mgnify:CR=1 FL=1